jgi:hypothetical protein
MFLFPKLIHMVAAAPASSLSSSSAAFEALCESLRQNDPTIVHVNAGYDNSGIFSANLVGWGGPLGAALSANTIVTQLSLNPQYFFAAPNNSAAAAAAAEAAAATPLLAFVRSSTRLHTVALGDKNATQVVTTVPLPAATTLQLVGQVLTAMAENPHITTLCANAVLPFDEFVHFLTSSPSIRHLELRLVALKYWNNHPTTTSAAAFLRNRVVTAMGACSRLETVHLSVVAEANDIVTDILHRLGAMECLRELRLDAHQTRFQNGHFMALSNLLRSTNSLASLTLTEGSLGRQGVEFLVQGLTNNATVAQLCLWACRFISKDALALLVAFLQDHANKNGNQLRKLVLKRNLGLDHKMLSNMLIGSALECLELHQANDIDLAVVFKNWTRHCSLVQLPELCVEGGFLMDDDVNALARYVAATNTLQDLRVTDIDPDCNSTTRLLRALRDNGSLLRVVLLESETNGSLFSESEQTLVDAMGQRNAHLGTLLAAPMDRSVEAAVVDVLIDDSRCNLLLLFPTLFWVAQKMPRRAHNAMFLGLLAMADDR